MVQWEEVARILRERLGDRFDELWLKDWYAEARRLSVPIQAQYRKDAGPVIADRNRKIVPAQQPGL